MFPMRLCLKMKSKLIENHGTSVAIDFWKILKHLFLKTIHYFSSFESVIFKMSDILSDSPAKNLKNLV